MAYSGKPIMDFPGYRVDSFGKVFSKYRELTPSITKNYKHISLRKDNTSHTKRVHRLVLETFVGPCPGGMECCHANGNSLDNN